MYESSLTICSVSFHSKKHLELNWELTTLLNHSHKIAWLVVENTPPGSLDALNLSSDHFHVLNGYEKDANKWAPASYHHGAALNKAIKFVDTRFLVFLDPDFYIVRQKWIDDVIRYMKANDLAFFGAPWHPQWIRKYRYFPCVHCLFIDLERINIGTLDFRPGEQNDKEEHRLQSQILQYFLLALTRCSVRLGFRFADDLKHRIQVGTQPDTGYRIYRRYHWSSRIRFECLQPVYRPSSEDSVQVFQRASNRILNKLLPDRFSYLPKRPEYYTRNGFRERGYVDATMYGWEEFIWKGAPFGFHIRSFRQSDLTSKEQIALAERIITNLTDIKVS